MKIVGARTLDERIAKLEQAVNYASAVHPVTVVAAAATFGTTPVYFGGLAVDRGVFRRLLPDFRWYVYAAGLVNPADGNVATLAISYQEDTTSTFRSVGTTTKTGAGLVKFYMGPFDLFATASVPAGETVPLVRFSAAKDAGASGTVEAVTLWMRFLPTRT